MRMRVWAIYIGMCLGVGVMIVRMYCEIDCKGIIFWVILVFRRSSWEISSSVLRE